MKYVDGVVSYKKYERWYKMIRAECNEQRPRFETEPLGNGLTLVRLYEDEQKITREAVSNMDTPSSGYGYTTYEMRTQLPSAALETAPDMWAEIIKQADYDAAAAIVRAQAGQADRRHGLDCAGRCQDGEG